MQNERTSRNAPRPAKPAENPWPRRYAVRARIEAILGDARLRGALGKKGEARIASFATHQQGAIELWARANDGREIVLSVRTPDTKVRALVYKEQEFRGKPRQGEWAFAFHHVKGAPNLRNSQFIYLDELVDPDALAKQYAEFSAALGAS